MPQRLSAALSGVLDRLDIDPDVDGDIDRNETTDARLTPCDKCGVRGKVSSWQYCPCPYGRQSHRRNQRYTTEQFPRAGAPARLKAYTLDTWDDLCGDDPEKQRARSFAADIVEHGRTQEPSGDTRCGLLLWGENSTGKTGLMVGLARHVFEQRRVLLWLRYEAMMRDIQARYGDADGPDADSLILSAQNVPVLFIDDLGRPFADDRQFRESEDRRELLYEILAPRHERDMPTFLTTNLDGLGQIAKQFDRRITDRLMEMCTVCKVGGRNLRKPTS